MKSRPRFAGLTLHNVRLASGLVLFAYLVTHLANHTLGLISLPALETGRELFLTLWRNLPGTLLLYGALLTHIGCALTGLYRRRRLKQPPWQTTQLIFGLLIPTLLLEHILGTRFAFELLETRDSYTYVLLVYFLFDPWAGIQQASVLLIAWTHASLGLHFWLRLKAGYERLVPYLYASALVFPLLALTGVWVAGRDILRLAADPAWLKQARATIDFADREGLALLSLLHNALLALFFVLLGGVLVVRVLRRWWQRRHGHVVISYPNGRRVEILQGTTILEASRGAGIPHASVCGGRGRCSTCRVRVERGLVRLPPASDAEARVLARVGVAPDVRLACQTRPSADVAVTPLLPSGAGPRAARQVASYLQGDEREVAILFADLRGFTALAADRLPYDTVFLLNRYFAAMGAAIEESGGRLDKFIGDGVMALFGIERGPAIGCRNALLAARLMAERLDEVNEALSHDLKRPLRMGIGIHVGGVIVGEMGYRHTTSVTAIGDAVNVASRLEAATKEQGVQLVVSQRVIERAGLDLPDVPELTIELRGLGAPLPVRLVAAARDLPVVDADKGVV